MENTLQSIINLRIDDNRKALAIRTLVNENVLTDSDVIKFLIDNSYTSILEQFLSVDKIKKRSLHASSGSSWTDNELCYYNIVFEDVSVTDIADINIELTDKALNFIESNKYFSSATLADKTGIEQVNIVTTEFQKCIVLVLNNPSMESCVDNMFQKFMESIMDTNVFLITQRYDMDLYISNVKRKATADIVAILFSKLYVGVVVVEDKPKDSSKTSAQWNNAEAQLVAEAIAIAQQNRWPEGTNIFMFRVMEVYVSVYKVKFSKELLTSVKTGTRRVNPFIISRYSPKDTLFENSTPGCNLLNPSDRELLTKLLNSISIEIKNYFDE